MKTQKNKSKKISKSITNSIYSVITIAVMVLTSHMKVDAQLSQVWSTRYNGTGNSDDRIAVSTSKMDAGGNIYVTGWSVGNGTSYDYITLKYSPVGQLLWSARYTGIGGTFYDFAYALEIDASGNVYVTGKSYGGGSDYDAVTVKYNSSGQLQWVQRFNGGDNGPDWAYSIALDGSGNVFIGGRSERSGSGTNSDYITVKYAPSGTMLWYRIYNGPGNVDDDRINSVTTDNSGNVYVTGRSGGTGTDYDMATLKYSSSGLLMWTARYNGSLNLYEEGKVVKVDASGNVYITGPGSAGGGYDYVTVKYNSSGIQQWVLRYDGPVNGYDEPFGMTIDASGNVYVIGASFGINTFEDYATVKYHTAGFQMWATRMNGPANGYDRGRWVAVDGSGNVYVTGISAGSGTGYDYATIKYSSSGVQLGNIMRYNGPDNDYDEALSVVVDNTGASVYVTGFSAGVGTNYDITTVKYSQTVGIENQNYPNPFNPTTNIKFSILSTPTLKSLFTTSRAG